MIFQYFINVEVKFCFMTNNFIDKISGKLFLFSTFFRLNLTLKAIGYNDFKNTQNLALRMSLIKMTKLEKLDTVSKSRSINIAQGLIPVSNCTKKLNITGCVNSNKLSNKLVNVTDCSFNLLLILQCIIMRVLLQSIVSAFTTADVFNNLNDFQDQVTTRGRLGNSQHLFLMRI